MCRSFVIFGIFTLICGPVLATVWVVDQGGSGDFLSIQVAIDNAQTGDEIIVNPGVYIENIDYLGKNLWIQSAEGPEDTVIDGGGGGELDRSCVTFRSGESDEAVLEGFSVQGGQGTNHFAATLEREALVGGGAFCLQSSPTFRHCWFLQNATEYAAGIYIESSGPSVTNCRFLNNTSQTYGGAISGANEFPVKINDCWFEENTAGNGGTIHLTAMAIIEDCTFVNNEAESGAGVNSPNYGADFVIRRCVFQGNHAHGTHGGAIRIHEASPIIEYCLFVGNSANLDGGAIFAIDGGDPVIESCTFYRNDAGRFGGHIALWAGTHPLISWCILAEAINHGGVYCSSASAYFQCNDAWSNTGGDYTGDCSDPTGTNGNISLDPLFCDPENDDFTLQAESPCAPFTPPNEECDLIGARPVGCYPPTAAQQTTWGHIKATYK